MKKIERTHYNGDLRIGDVGKEVALVGWVSKVRDLGSLTFVDLRDRSGIIQITYQNEENNFPQLNREFLVHVYGVVHKKEVPNKELKTGEIEVLASRIEIINKAETTPMIIDDKTDALEETRLKYRYLDLRRPVMQHYLSVRAKISQAAHRFLDENGFTEIETPILSLSSPEGARDYLVPSRVNEGQFYALPQSPQLYKQLLMISGMERYYQVAKCFRDEDLRADRQPDFTQIDIEISFLSQEEILELMEKMLQKIFKDSIDYDLKLPLRQMKYDEAVNTYGSDKPDTRFNLHIHDVKDCFKEIEFDYFKECKYIKGFKVEQKASVFSRKYNDDLALLAKKFGMRNYFIIKMENNEIASSLSKFLTEDIKSQLIREFDLHNNDVICIAASSNLRNVNFGLGALRSRFGKEFDLIDYSVHDVLWVVEWPLFAYDEETNSLSPEHHPFTRPLDEHLHLLKDHPEQVYAYCFDIVIDGYEAGGGSIRIHDPVVQKQVFEILGLSDEDIKNKFGYFIDAFKYGTPPHGGLAFGLERLTMTLTNTDNIRDVIAFPKNLKARCPMSGAPSFVDDKQLEELHIKVVKE